MKASDFLSQDEIRDFTERSDLAGAWQVLCNWLLIGAIFAMVITWTNPLTLLLAILLLGGRQLGLAVLMHEAGHKTLFKSQGLNEWVGQWHCAYPVLGDVGVGLTVALEIVATSSGLMASVFAVSRMLAMLTDMNIIPHRHLGMQGDIQKHTLV